ncbi:ArnT family glycosyltransferase [Terriglobus aquaticus]|uniref:ArnT family glycosyltransferase n=1 Tax=Terriglobus aquaticus TaxID=940139 RepID=A0ABW9KHC2_9BACT|nr:phospholipid carrier-dependent glycosyltransferase [Terriglobus aquaticus]
MAGCGAAYDEAAMHGIPQRPRKTLHILGWLWFAFYCTFALISPPLLDDADSVHAEVAREMIVRHDYVTLYANGIRYLEKAPLLYWSMAASMRLLRVHNETARLPLALYTLALLLLVERFAREAFRSARAGLYAGMILLSSFGLFIFTRILIPDAMVCLWYVLALWAFWRMEAYAPEQRVPWQPAAILGTACALNVLTKGLIGLVFPVGTIALYLAMTRGKAMGRRIAQLRPLFTIVVFFVIAAPWHIAIARANPSEGDPQGLHHTGRLLPWFWRGWSVPEPTWGHVHGWTWFYFMNEHVLRYLNLRVPRDYDTVPLVLFWGLLLVWLMPWSAFLPQALASIPVDKVLFRARLGMQDRIMLLVGTAALLPLVFFSFSTRQEYYVLPSLPFLAMLLGRWLERETVEAETNVAPTPLHNVAMRSTVVLLTFGSLAALACAYFLLHTSAPIGPVDLATLLKQNPGDYALSFGHFLDLNARAMAMFRLPLGIAGAALFGGAFAAWWARREWNPHAANMLLLSGAMAFLLAAHVGLTTFSPVLTSFRLSQAISRQIRPGEIIILNDEYEAGSSLGFYLRRSDIHILHGHSANLWYGSFFTDAPNIWEDDLTLRARWLTTQRIYLWTEPDKMPNLPVKPYLVAESGGKMIVSNQPNR